MNDMNKTQVTILMILALIACVVFAGVGVIFYIFFASQEVAQAPPTALPPAPEPTATPTITPTPLELPTSMTESSEPTPVNTPVVAATPSPTPGQSLTEQMTGLKGEVSQEQSVSEQASSGIDVRFWADNTSLQGGSCTNLHWQVEGVTAYWIDGQPGAGPTGELHICPSGNETHILRYDESVDGLLRSKEIQVSISVSARPESGSSGSGSSGDNSGSSGSGGSSSAIIIAELDTANGITGLSGFSEPYAIGVTIYDNGDVLVSWAGCGSGAEWTQLSGDKIELQNGDASQGPYFSISATWDRNGNSVAGETQMLTVDADSRGVCAIHDAFLMR